MLDCGNVLGDEMNLISSDEYVERIRKEKGTVKNKDKYDLRKIELRVDYIGSNFNIGIFYEGKELHEIKKLGKLETITEALCKWLEEDYDNEDNKIGYWDNYDETHLKDLTEPLQELIDKATPKKIKNRTKWNALCPSCDELFVFGEDPKRPYCPFCGQALDWSEVDE